ncbi:MAG TPA: signal peptide peptidase SppA [Halothiobacillaceae bacterium]|nr:signal peptide peptidase SppA [Halothiobacillaceae bacterium]
MMTAVIPVSDTRRRNFVFLVLFFGAIMVTGAAFLLYTFWVFGSVGDRTIAIGDAVAVVDIVGEIYYDRAKVDEIEDYIDDDRVKAVVVFINSPGGGVAASQALYHAVARVRQFKPVVASMASVAASGGYYVACGADSIMAEEGTLTGSIGVIASFLNTEELYHKIGLDVTVIKSGRWKDVGSPHREITPVEQEYLSTILDSSYQQFLEAVADGRRIPLDEVRELAEGRLYTGAQALDAGLVDRLGSYRDAVDLAAAMGGIKGEPRVIRHRPRRSLLERILGQSLSPVLENRRERVSLKYIIP